MLGKEKSNEQPNIGENVDLYIKWLQSEQTFNQVDRLDQYNSGNKVLEWGMSLGTSWMSRQNALR